MTKAIQVLWLFFLACVGAVGAFCLFCVVFVQFTEPIGWAPFAKSVALSSAVLLVGVIWWKFNILGCSGAAVSLFKRGVQAQGRWRETSPGYQNIIVILTVFALAHFALESRELRNQMRKVVWFENYRGYAALPELERDRIVWDLQEYHQWGSSRQKPVCRDLLQSQAHSCPNAPAWTIDAIDLVEKQGWKDLSPLISKLYERPRHLGVYERAFRYLRSQEGNPVSTNIIAAAATLRAAGYWRSTVSDAQLSAAQEHLLREADKEAVLVYAVIEAVQSKGKGGTERGRRAAAAVLKGLDRDAVAQRLRQLEEDCPRSYADEIEWVSHYLSHPFGNDQK